MAGKRKGRVLFVEDEEEYRKLLRLTLEGAGYEVLEASNGADGLRLFEEGRPDLVLLDVVLPDMLGFDLRERMKAPPAGMPPVLFCTVRSAARSLARGAELGSADYVLKPFDPKDLLERVAAALATRKG
jgi:two-component system OmpR family response regulator